MKLEDLAEQARDLATKLFAIGCSQPEGSPSCVQMESDRPLTQAEKALGWSRRPFDGYDPYRLCLECRCYWHAELCAQAIHRARCLAAKYPKK